MSEFTAETLPVAVASLFRLNHYEVVGPVKLNGAEIDLVATPVGSPFAPTVYIEVTVEYVNNAKYGKDLTKLMLVRERDPAATCLIVSAVGFTADVLERARVTRVETLTYAALFGQFEKFQPYVELMTGDSRESAAVSLLASVYQPPSFVDTHGTHDALAWMQSWLSSPDSSKSWLIITGEYGTGKSALTRMLQRRWIEDYIADPTAPIPVRIELGDFARQFDAQGLLHHFLDHNNLGHVPIDFFWSLIRSGRVVLLLDGYDEMAQYLSQRERRQTLKALAELSGDGVRGVLTSRPNYFTETEELALFDHLYREMALRSRLSDTQGEEIQRRERDVDDLIQRSILDRYERALRDLTPEQSRALVRRTLEHSPDAAETVIAVLDRVFRTSDENAEVALSGKPVIISYLIDLAGSLHDTVGNKLSEWEVYTLIVDKLALRDMEQTARVRVDERRSFLHALAVALTKSGEAAIGEEKFRDLIEKVFRGQLRRFTGARRAAEIDSLFEDLRRSGTLTRHSDGSSSAWKFSHNSLREFLVAEFMLDELIAGKPLRTDPPVSDAMRALVASRPSAAGSLFHPITAAWSDLENNPAAGTFLTLAWDALYDGVGHTPLEQVAGLPPLADGVNLAGLQLSAATAPADLHDARFRGSTILEVSFRAADLRRADFSGSLLEATSFEDADLSSSSFVGAVLVDVSLAGATVVDADFREINSDVSLIVEGRVGRERVEGARALGLLWYHGALVDPVDDYFKWMNHPRFSIVQKVVAKLVEGGVRQRRGLEQRGAAAMDPPFAKRLLKRFDSLGYVATPLGRPELVEITSAGRATLGSMHSARTLPAEVVSFLVDERG